MTDDDEASADDGHVPEAGSGTSGDESAPAAPKAAAGGPKRKHLSRTRGVIAWILIVLASLMVPLSVITVWAINTTTNTDRYVETMAPLAREKVITDFVAQRATERIFSAVQVQQKVQGALPKRAEFLAVPLVNQVQGFVQTQLTKLLNSTYFQNLWDKANRRSHAAVVAVLTGKGTPQLKKANNVIVDITPVVDKAINQLDAKGITIFNGVKPKLARANTLTVNLVSGKQISKARGIFRVVTDLGWAIPVVAVLLIAAAVAVATDRRKTLLRVAVGAGLATLVFLAALAIGRNFFVGHAAGRIDPAVTTAAFTTITRFLTEGLKWVVLACVVVALGLWLAGPSTWAALDPRPGRPRRQMAVGPSQEPRQPGEPRQGLGRSQAGGVLDTRARLGVAHRRRRGRRPGDPLRWQPVGVRRLEHGHRPGGLPGAPPAGGVLGPTHGSVGPPGFPRRRRRGGAARRPGRLDRLDRRAPAADLAAGPPASGRAVARRHAPSQDQPGRAGAQHGGDDDHEEDRRVRGVQPEVDRDALAVIHREPDQEDGDDTDDHQPQIALAVPRRVRALQRGPAGPSPVVHLAPPRRTGATGGPASPHPLCRVRAPRGGHWTHRGRARSDNLIERGPKGG